MNKSEFLDYVNSFNKDAGEFTEDELYQIGVKHKELNLSDRDWDGLVKMLGVKGKDGELKSGETFRCWIKNRQANDGTLVKNVHMLAGNTVDKMTFDEFAQKTEEIKQDLYKQQTKTRDAYNVYRRTLRDDARIDNLHNIIKESISQLKPLIWKKNNPMHGDEDMVEAVMLFSDLHMGLNVDNFFNRFNKEIANERVMKYVDNVIEYCHENNVTKLNFCSLGDTVGGALHISTRVENCEDRVDEIISASELIANALAKLSENIPVVTYRSVSGNHDRMSPNYRESIEKENFVRLIDWYLEERLKNTDINFAHDTFDDNFGAFALANGDVIAYVHGHHDSDLTNSLLGFSNYLNHKINYLLVGHLHSPAMKNVQGSTVIRNGSICGVDTFSETIRAFCPPSQTLMIFDKLGNTHLVDINLDVE